MAQQGREGGPAIDFQKVFTERVTIRFNAPPEPEINISGGELLHGYLCDIYRLRDRSDELRELIDNLTRKWNVFYVS